MFNLADQTSLTANTEIIRCILASSSTLSLQTAIQVSFNKITAAHDTV